MRVSVLYIDDSYRNFIAKRSFPASRMISGGSSHNCVGRLAVCNGAERNQTRKSPFCPGDGRPGAQVGARPAAGKD